MRAIIVGGGIEPSEKLIRAYMDDNSFIIAADSGADILHKYNISPDYLIGDFDSIACDVYESMKDNKNVTKLPREKDFTDTYVAFEKAVDLGAEEIVIFGGTGKRLDHFMANLCVLYKGIEEDVRTYMVDDHNKMFMTNKSIRLKGQPGQMISVFAYGEAVEGLTLTGVKYPLNDFYLSPTNGLTVSNEFLEQEAGIKFKKGCLLVMINN